MESWTVRGIEFQKYDVVEVDYGQGFLDYATIKDGSDVAFGVRLVREGGGFNNHPRALYRITRGNEVVFEVGGLDDEIKDLLTACKNHVPLELVRRINKLI